MPHHLPYWRGPQHGKWMCRSENPGESGATEGSRPTMRTERRKRNRFAGMFFLDEAVARKSVVESNVLPVFTIRQGLLSAVAI